MFTEVAPGVFSVDSRFVDGKNGIVVGAREALAVDGSNFPDEGRAMADFIREQGREPERLALTHGHGDHILGAAPLAGGEVYAHALTPVVIRRQLPGWARRWRVPVAEAETRVVWPTVTYRDELRMDLGGKCVWMFPTPGHSDDGVSVYVEEDRLLFSGDSVVTGIVPAIGDGNSEVLEASMHRLMDVEIEILVPGHGEPLHGKGQVREWLQWQVSYLSGVRARVQEGLNRGNDADAVADAVDFGKFIGNRLPVEKHGMPKRHRNTVLKIVEEEWAKRA